MSDKSIRRVVGHVGSDSGLVWIGDPRYTMFSNTMPKDIGTSWLEFCEKLYDKRIDGDTAQFNYDGGCPGLGVVVEVGYKDGMYPVVARIDEKGRVISVTIRFI